MKLSEVLSNVSQQDCFNMETVVSSRYLPELLMAAPVWFFEPKVKPESTLLGSQNSIDRYFCGLGVTDRFALLFRMYNRTPRNFNEFTGRDVMPLPVIELVSKVRNSFDYLVIATPYHDLVSSEWRDARWIRNIDPFLFGFLKQVPELMFFLGRWSGTGLFPLVGEMIADTVEHIRKNKHLLRDFNRIPRSGYFYSVDNPRIIDLDLEISISKTFITFADDLLQQFQQGNLFSWLRGDS